MAYYAAMGATTDFTVTEGSGTGTLRGYNAASPAFGSISGLTTANGAAIRAIQQSSESVKGSTVYVLSVVLTGVRAAGFWTSITIDGHGTILESSKSTINNDGSYTTWTFTVNATAVIDGSGTFTGRFT